MNLYLTADDGSTVSLVSDGVVLLDGYYPRTSRDQNTRVSDGFDLRINGTYAEISAKVAEINRLFDYASRNYYGPVGVWLYFAMGSEPAWRARVYGGLIEYDNRLGFYVGRQALKAGIVIERDPFWEGPEAQIPLTNGNGTNNLSGLNVFNCNDGTGTSPNKKNNYVEIAAASIGGDLPAAVRLEMINSLDSTARLQNIWMSLNNRSDPANFQNILEAEYASYGGSVVVSSSYSGGEANTFTWSGDNQAMIARWTLDTTFLNRANKRWFKILAAFTVAPSANTIRVQCKITFPAGTPLTEVASSQEVLLSSTKMQEIGELQIPPWLLSSGDLAPVDLTLYAKKTGGGSLGLDYLHITPLDGYRVLVPRGYGAAYLVRVVDDGINNQIYTDGWSPAGKTGHYTSVGKPLAVEPNKKQRIYFLQSGNTGDISTSRKLSVKAYYRPRRVGL